MEFRGTQSERRAETGILTAKAEKKTTGTEEKNRADVRTGGRRERRRYGYGKRGPEGAGPNKKKESPDCSEDS